MTFSKLTTATSGNAGQYSSRGSGVDRFIVHHAATTSLSGVLSMMSTGSREVSANYVIKDGQIVGVVPEEYRAWTSGTATWDGRSITVETCNSAAGDASGWPISEESYRSLAALIADCATRYGFPLDRDHVIGHRDLYSRHGASYPTQCPGGIDLDRVVREARAAQNTGGLSMSDINEIIKRLDRIESGTNLTRYAFDKIIGPALGRIDRWRWKTDNQVDPRIEKKLDKLAARLDALEANAGKREG